MKLIFDEAKRQANLVKHGLDLGDAADFEWETATYFPTRPSRTGRARCLAIGRIGSHVVVVVFSPLASEGLSIVSLRPASRNERKLHASR